MIREKAFNIVIKIADKLIAGTTDVDFKMTPEYEESLVKDDEGEPSLDATGVVPMEFGVSGLMYICETEDETTHQDITDLREVCHDSDPVTFSYGGKKAGDAIITGNAHITDLQEKSGSKGKPDWSITLKKTGSVTFGVAE